jgi:hypothetical protein
MTDDREQEGTRESQTEFVTHALGAVDPQTGSAGLGNHLNSGKCIGSGHVEPHRGGSTEGQGGPERLAPDSEATATSRWM